LSLLFVPCSEEISSRDTTGIADRADGVGDRSELVDVLLVIVEMIPIGWFWDGGSPDGI
jgi:hypothetical protein